MTIRRCASPLALAALAACASQPAGSPSPSALRAPQYLFLWTAAPDSTRPDYLAVLDVTERGDSAYGRVVARLDVPGRGNVPHHTEHQMSPGGRLFANGFGAGKTSPMATSSRPSRCATIPPACGPAAWSS